MQALPQPPALPQPRCRRGLISERRANASRPPWLSGLGSCGRRSVGLRRAAPGPQGAQGRAAGRSTCSCVPALVRRAAPGLRQGGGASSDISNMRGRVADVGPQPERSSRPLPSSDRVLGMAWPPHARPADGDCPVKACTYHDARSIARRQGGDVDFGTLRLLHAHAGLPGAIPIVGGLWQGGFEAAQERVRAGQLDPQSFRCARGGVWGGHQTGCPAGCAADWCSTWVRAPNRPSLMCIARMCLLHAAFVKCLGPSAEVSRAPAALQSSALASRAGLVRQTGRRQATLNVQPYPRRIFTRVAGWGPGQLEGECAAGVWYTAAASAGLALDAGAGADAWQRVRRGGRSCAQARRAASSAVRTGQRRCRGAQAAGAADVSGSASCVRWRAPPSSAKSSCSVGKSGAGCTVRRRPKLLRVRGPAATRLVSRAGAGADGPARLVLPRPARSRARGRAPGAREQAARRGRRPCKALSRAHSSRTACGAHAQAQCEPRRIPVAVYCVGAQGMHSCRCGRCAAAPGSRHSLVSHSDERVSSCTRCTAGRF